MKSYRVTQDIHPIMAFQEGATGLSGGHGYGFYSEDFLFPGYAAFQATTHNEYGGAAATYGWIYVLNAVVDRDAAKQYFAVVGDQAPSGYIPGDIVQGTGANSKILRTTPDGTWHVVNAATTADVLIVTNAGVATLPLYAGTGSRPAYFTASGQLEAGTLSGGVVTCP